MLELSKISQVFTRFKSSFGCRSASGLGQLGESGGFCPPSRALFGDYGLLSPDDNTVSAFAGLADIGHAIVLVPTSFRAVISTVVEPIMRQKRNPNGKVHA
jgi:hypothetical protein